MFKMWMYFLDMSIIQQKYTNTDLKWSLSYNELYTYLVITS